MSDSQPQTPTSHVPQMIGSLIVALVIVAVTIAVVTARLGTSPELLEERREEAEDAREERQEADEERNENGRSAEGLRWAEAVSTEPANLVTEMSLSNVRASWARTA
jgi:type II secretory pathway pseudopilin PulG